MHYFSLNVCSVYISIHHWLIWTSMAQNNHQWGIKADYDSFWVPSWQLNIYNCPFVSRLQHPILIYGDMLYLVQILQENLFRMDEFYLFCMNLVKYKVSHFSVSNLFSEPEFRIDLFTVYVICLYVSSKTTLKTG